MDSEILSVLVTTVIALGGGIGTYRASLKQTRNKMETVEDKQAETDLRYAEKWATAESQIALLQKELKDERENNLEQRGGLKKEIEILTRELEKARDERDKFYAETLELRVNTNSRISDLEKELARLNGQVIDLQNQIKQVNDEKRLLMETLETKIAEAVKAATEPLNQEIARLKKEIDEKDKIIRDLKVRLNG